MGKNVSSCPLHWCTFLYICYPSTNKQHNSVSHIFMSWWSQETREQETSQKKKKSFPSRVIMQPALKQVARRNAAIASWKTWDRELTAISCFIPACISAVTLGLQLIRNDLQLLPSHPKEKTIFFFLLVLLSSFQVVGGNCYVYRMFLHFEHFSPNFSHFKTMHITV